MDSFLPTEWTQRKVAAEDRIQRPTWDEQMQVEATNCPRRSRFPDRGERTDQADTEAGKSKMGPCSLLTSREGDASAIDNVNSLRGLPEAPSDHLVEESNDEKKPFHGLGGAYQMHEEKKESKLDLRNAEHPTFRDSIEGVQPHFQGEKGKGTGRSDSVSKLSLKSESAVVSVDSPAVDVVSFARQRHSQTSLHGFPGGRGGAAAAIGSSAWRSATAFPRTMETLIKRYRFSKFVFFVCQLRVRKEGPVTVVSIDRRPLIKRLPRLLGPRPLAEPAEQTERFQKSKVSSGEEASKCRLVEFV